MQKGTASDTELLTDNKAIDPEIEKTVHQNDNDSENIKLFNCDTHDAMRCNEEIRGVKTTS